MSEHTIEALCKRSHEISLEKGWVTAEGDPRSYACVTNLNHSELSEAMEEYRNHKKFDEVYYEATDYDERSGQTFIVTRAEIDGWTEEDRKLAAPKPCGIPIELADFVIRICQHSGTSGFGTLLASAVQHLEPEPVSDFDELLAWLHMCVAQSYAASKKGDGVLEMVIAPLGKALATVFDYYKKNGLDLWTYIDEKEAYNRTRSFRHGNKKV
jgi:hypothetical protein